MIRTKLARCSINILFHLCFLFPSGCTVFLCDFHREQAWERWLSKSNNGMAAYKEEVLMMMRQIAQSSYEEECNAKLETLQTSEVWNRHESLKLREWFSNTWLSEKKVCNITLKIIVLHSSILFDTTQRIELCRIQRRKMSTERSSFRKGPQNEALICVALPIIRQSLTNCYSYSLHNTPARFYQFPKKVLYPLCREI